MSYTLDRDRPQRAIVMVSRMGHCLNDLIFRWRAGSLGGELVAVVSNHEDAAADGRGRGPAVRPHPGHRRHQSRRPRHDCSSSSTNSTPISSCWRATCRCSPTTSAAGLRGRAINIHHSFLPGFKGAKPYHQAYDRGVKLVGATAHYVTPDLDEGPIIEQEVIRIDHAFDPARLATVGQDAEALALSRAVRWHCERRVLLYGRSTVIFR